MTGIKYNFTDWISVQYLVQTSKAADLWKFKSKYL